MEITITDKTVQEVKRILITQEFDNDAKIYLRLRIVGGGCSGFSHKLDLDSEIKEGMDETYKINGLEVVIDKRSAIYLDGVIIDFHDDLNHRGFGITNPNARSVCGCGSSMSF